MAEDRNKNSSYRDAGYAAGLKRLRRENAGLKVEMAQLRHQYESLLDSSPEFIWTKDREGRFTLVNQAVASAYGVSRFDMVGKRDKDFVPAEMAARFAAVDKLVLETGTTIHLAEQISIPGIAETWIDTIKTALRDPDGRITGTIGIARDITPLKDAYDREQFKDRLLNSIEVPIVALTPQNIVTYWNQAAADLYGWPAEELLGRNVLDVIRDERMITQVREMLTALRYQPVLTREVLMTHRSGREFNALLTTSPVKTEQAEVIGYVGITTDITELKETERKLREQQQQLEALFRKTSNPIMVADENARYIDANDAALEFLETTREELLTKKVWDYAPPESLTPLMEEHLPFMEPRSLETDYFVNGRTKTLWLDIVPVEREGEIVMYGIGQDITARKRMLNALAESEEMLKTTTRTARIGGWQYDHDTDELRWTEESYRLAGVGNDFDLTLENALKIFNQPYRDEFRRALFECIESGTTFSLDTQYTTAQGEQRWARITAKPHEVDGRRIASGTTQDITEQKLSELHIRQAQKMAGIGTLAGGIAHDFNNILFAIQGNVEVMAGLLPESSPLVRHLSEIRDASDRAKELINQLLLYSRSTTDKRSSHLLPDALAAIRAIIESILPTGVNIREYWDDENLAVNASANELHQIFLNLGVNAGHAMQETGGTLTVRGGKIELPDPTDPMVPDLPVGEYVLVVFADTGCGIPATELERIFEPFYSTRDVGKGTGMGLAIVHSIVKALNGAIRVESAVGEGTRFLLYLPLAPAGDATTVIEAVQPPAARVLVADTDSTVLQLVSRIIERMGHDVIACPSHKYMLEVLADPAQVPKLVLLDESLLQAAGRELAQVLKKNCPTAPVLLMANTGLGGGTNPFINAAGILNKPIEKPVLEATIQNQLENVR